MPESQSSKPDPVIERYRAFRTRQRALNAAIVAAIDRLTLEEAASLLGLKRRGEIVVRSDGAKLALLEFAMFDIYRGGLNVAQRFLQRHPAPTPEDREVADSTGHACFRVAEVQPGTSDGRIALVDQLRGEALNLIDTNLATSLRAGDLISIRTQPLDDACVSNGSVFVFSGRHRTEALSRLDSHGFIARFKDLGRSRTPEWEANVPKLMMRAALEFGLDRQLVQRAAS